MYILQLKVENTFFLKKPETTIKNFLPKSLKLRLCRQFPGKKYGVIKLTQE